MNYSAEDRALIWLCGCTNLEYRERAALLSAAKNPVTLFEEWEKFSLQLIKEEKNGLYKIEREERERELCDLLDKLEKYSCFAVTLLGEDYPDSLKAIPCPPFVLFGAGNRELLSMKKFCIVGSRITPPWAEKLGREISKTLSSRFVIVTGLAEGGDCAAIAGALESGNLISVLPTGLDVTYPAAHASLKNKIRQNGLLLTEYAFGEGAKKYTFQARNRVLAGLSEGVLVLSAGERSGTLITANCALDYGRDVFALPHNVGAAQGVGCNELIKKGAYLATGAEDILCEYGYAAETREEIPLSDEERVVLSALRQLGEAHVAQLAELTKMQVHQVAAILSALELKNTAVKSGGNRYSAV